MRRCAPPLYLLMLRQRFSWTLLVLLASASALGAQDVRERVRDRGKVRERTRPAVPDGTSVTQSQGEAVTLTIGSVSPRLVQTWIRAAGAIDAAERVVSADISGRDAALVQVGQRVRAFPPSAKSSMYQAFVTRVTPRPNGVHVEATLRSQGRTNVSLYVIEIVVEQGPMLSVPNEAIIEEDAKRVVYVQKPSAQYVPQEIHTGIQGELYTQVIDGVKEGDQVVTFGSFFIDAEQKLKGTVQTAEPPASR